MDTTFIYFLKDPENPKKGYVGKTDRPRKRLSDHYTECRDKTHRRANWLKALATRKLKPTLQIVDEVPFDYWPQCEVAYIEFFLEQGYELVNITPGGDCGPSRLGTKHSEETIAKMCETRRGEKHPHFGKKFSPEYCAKLSAAHIGLPSGMRGKKHKSESLAKISASKTGKKFTPEQKLKHAEVRLGVKYVGAKSKYRGVSWRAARNNWRVRIVVKGAVIFIGNFSDEIEAAKAYDASAIKYYGDSAKLNFPD